MNGSITENFNQQSQHIAYIISEALARGAEVVEPSLEAQDAYVDHIRATAMDNSAWVAECTPGYFNNEGEQVVTETGDKKFRSYLGEIYGPGYYAFEKLLKDWRDKGDLEGLGLKGRFWPNDARPFFPCRLQVPEMGEHRERAVEDRRREYQRRRP